MFNAINNFLDWIDPPLTPPNVPLRGKTFVLSVFMNCRGGEWDDEDMMKVCRKQETAQKWLSEAAAKYGKRISWDTMHYEIDGPKLPQAIRGANSRQAYLELRMLALKQLGFPTLRHVEKWLLKNSNCDNWILVLYTKQKYRCRAWCEYLDSKADIPFAGGCMVSLNGLGGAENMRLLHSRIAHEFLHLYGAMDFYQEKDVALSPKRARRAKYHVPNSIMRRDGPVLCIKELDSLTAWLVGLTDKRENWFDEILSE